MTFDEWYALGTEILESWNRVNRDDLTAGEMSAFEYAWELAWENRSELQ